MEGISRILNELLSMGRSVKIAVTGGSMYPFLRGSRDCVTLEVLSGRLRVGDIALALRPDGSYVLHRIVRLDEAGFTMLGDAQTVEEGPLPLESIVAVVSAVSRDGREISTESFLWKSLSFLWMRLRPLRSFLLRALRRLDGFGRDAMRGLTAKFFRKKESLAWLLRECGKIRWRLILLVLLSVAATLCGVLLAISSKTVIDAASSGDGGLAAKCLAMAAIVVLNLSLQSLTNMLSTRATIRFEALLKQSLFERILRKEWLSASKFHSGDLTARLTSDVSVIAGGVIGIAPAIFSLFTQLVAALCVLFVLDSTFALIALALGPAVVLFGRFYSKRSRRLHKRCQETDSAARAYMQEALQSLVLIKAFSTERRTSEGLRGALESNIAVQIKRNTFSVLAGMGLNLGYWLGYLFAIGWGAFRLSAGRIGFGTLAAFIQLIGQVQTPFTGLAKTFPRIFSVLASAERLIELEKLPDEAAEPEGATGLDVEKLVIEDLSFSYEDEKVLNNVSIEYKKGEFVVLAGPSGEGKTTLLRVLLGLVEPKSGCAYLVGKNGERLKIGPDTRKFFTYVPQGNLIVSGTIAENIRYGNPGASDAEMVECAKAACIYDFIRSLPQQFDTPLGERGLGLSEGQAQRIAIARALLNRAPVLLLDEATSALDPALEKSILENLKEYARDRILIFVSHRRSIDRLCKRAIILENGVFRETSPETGFRAKTKESIKLPANFIFKRL